MKVYLDICCLKRPFDSQEDSIVRLEAEAITSILILPSDRVVFVRSRAQRLENSLNPLRWRREAVGAWLDEMPAEVLEETELSRRTAELIALGFKNFDALHLASAEACADVLLTVDERFRRKAATVGVRLRVEGPLTFLQEVSEWKI